MPLGEHAGSPLQPRHDVGFGRGIPPRKPLTKVALGYDSRKSFYTVLADRYDPLEQCQFLI